MGATLGRRKVAAALATGAVVAFGVLVLSGAPDRAGAGGEGTPRDAGLEQILKIRESLDAAGDAVGSPGRGFDSQLIKAKRLKLIFVQDYLLKGQTLFGCDDPIAVEGLEVDLDQIDSLLAKAQHYKGDLRSQVLARAARIAENFNGKITNCPGLSDPPQAAKQIEKITAQLNKADKVSDRELDADAKAVSSLKRKLLKGQKVYGCDFVEFFVALEEIDVAIVHAQEAELPRNANDQEKDRIVRERQKWVRAADKGVEKLFQTWIKIPCP